MFLFLSASRCKEQSRLFSESCRGTVVLKAPETKGGKLREPQTGLTPLLYKQIHNITPLNNAHCSSSPWQHRQAGMPGAQPRKVEHRDVQSSVLYSAPLITWAGHCILNIYSREFRAHPPTGSPQSWEFAACCSSQVVTSLGSHWCFPQNSDSNI